MCHWFGWYADEGITIDEKYRNKLSSSNTHYESSVLFIFVLSGGWEIALANWEGKKAFKLPITTREHNYYIVEMENLKYLRNYCIVEMENLKIYAHSKFNK